MPKTIELSCGEYSIVDDDDFEKINQYKWYVLKCTHSFYAVRRESGRPLLMHRQIMGLECDKQVDHINHNGLDNRKSNLRIATCSQNQHNRRLQINNKSGYKGVSWTKHKNKWRANIRLNGKDIHLGYYENLIDAALAYDDAAKKYHEDFAVLNFD